VGNHQRATCRHTASPNNLSIDCVKCYVWVLACKRQRNPPSKFPISTHQTIDVKHYEAYHTHGTVTVITDNAYTMQYKLLSHLAGKTSACTAARWKWTQHTYQQLSAPSWMVVQVNWVLSFLIFVTCHGSTWKIRLLSSLMKSVKMTKKGHW
jgi:hypothetical protein